jgi:hypothetical protein
MLKLQNQIALSRAGMFAGIALLFAAAPSCSRSQKPAAEKIATAPKTFASPDEAGAALVQAYKSGDRASLIAIFGPDAEEVLFSGDPVKDQDARQNFSAAFAAMHRWVPIKAGGEVLVVGEDNHPFAIPLGQNSSGQWYFDTAAGKDEILARRIGRGELTAIEACGALAEAEHDYFNTPHDGDPVKQYAKQLVSDPGKQNGLYWPASDGQSASPLENLGDLAKALGYANAGDKPQPFNGYYYRIITKQGDGAPGGAKEYIVNGKMTGGFAILAYPAEYRNSGIMTFIVGTDGVVYQKDLGEKTPEAATAITEYNPRDGWTPALMSDTTIG